MIADEFERTRRMLLVVKQQERLLDKNPVLSRSIRLRNPYVDAMSLIQVDLLCRKQLGDNTEALNYALGATINGIAAMARPKPPRGIKAAAWAKTNTPYTASGANQAAWIRFRTAASTSANK